MTKESDSFFQVPHRNGRLLCSPRDPVKEAQEWLARQNLREDDQRILVFGFGAGFHVEVLTKSHPDIEVHVFEIDKLFHNSQIYFVDECSSIKYDAFLPFRPAWAGLESEYLKAYLQATGRDHHPDLFFANKTQSEVKLWLCLRELVK